ncbi:MAG: hypothetical protein ACO1OQ_03565 [Rufibacter sp.]
MPTSQDHPILLRLLPVLVILFLLGIYSFLPTQNPTADAYFYAASIRWKVEFWEPHHLLYNPTGVIFYQVLQVIRPGIDVLRAMQLMNALSAAGSLLVLWNIVKQLQPNKVFLQGGLLLLTGSCFATLRYSTENETYILPILFSLTGSFYWIKYGKTSGLKHLFWASMWASVACLFHQIHFFWWLGLLLSTWWFSEQKWKVLLIFVGPALLVPAVYIGVALGEKYPLAELHKFVFRDFFTGVVQTEIGLSHFLMTPISLVRTFLEVHGRLFHLLQQNWLFALPMVLLFMLLAYLTRQLSRDYRLIKLQEKRIFLAFAFITTLQLLFAWYAVGNAEFMVMFPFLGAILLACFSSVKQTAVSASAVVLFLWNLTYGILPNYFATYANTECLYALVSKQPSPVLLLQDQYAFTSYHMYKTGKRYPHLYDVAMPKGVLTQIIAEAEEKRQLVLTDFSEQSQPFSRATFLGSSSAKEFFSHYQLSRLQRCTPFYGRSILFSVSKP